MKNNYKEISNLESRVDSTKNYDWYKGNWKEQGYRPFMTNENGQAFDCSVGKFVNWSDLGDILESRGLPNNTIQTLLPVFSEGSSENTICRDRVCKMSFNLRKKSLKYDVYQKGNGYVLRSFVKGYPKPIWQYAPSGSYYHQDGQLIFSSAVLESLREKVSEIERLVRDIEKEKEEEAKKELEEISENTQGDLFEDDDFDNNSSGPYRMASLPENLYYGDPEVYDTEAYELSEKYFNVLRGTEVKIVVLNEYEQVVAALFTDETNSEKFSFDVVVHPDYQRMGIGKDLVEAAIQEFEYLKDVYGEDYYIDVHVINPNMRKMLEDHFNFEVDQNLNQTDVTMKYQKKNNKIKYSKKNKNIDMCESKFKNEKENNIHITVEKKDSKDKDLKKEIVIDIKGPKSEVENIITLQEAEELQNCLNTILSENNKWYKISEKIPGGLSDGEHPEKYNKKQLEKGTKVEMEHTSDKEVAREIAMDHLEEDPSYYTKLEKMEKKFATGISIDNFSKEVSEMIYEKEWAIILSDYGLSKYGLDTEDIKIIIRLMLEEEDSKRVVDIFADLIRRKLIEEDSPEYKLMVETLNTVLRPVDWERIKNYGIKKNQEVKKKIKISQVINEETDILNQQNQSIEAPVQNNQKTLGVSLLLDSIGIPYEKQNNGNVYTYITGPTSTDANGWTFILNGTILSIRSNTSNQGADIDATQISDITAVEEWIKNVVGTSSVQKDNENSQILISDPTGTEIGKFYADFYNNIVIPKLLKETNNIAEVGRLISERKGYGGQFMYNHMHSDFSGNEEKQKLDKYYSRLNQSGSQEGFQFTDEKFNNLIIFNQDISSILQGSIFKYSPSSTKQQNGNFAWFRLQGHDFNFVDKGNPQKYRIYANADPSSYDVFLKYLSNEISSFLERNPSLKNYINIKFKIRLEIPDFERADMCVIYLEIHENAADYADQIYNRILQIVQSSPKGTIHERMSVGIPSNSPGVGGVKNNVSTNEGESYTSQISKTIELENEKLKANPPKDAQSLKLYLENLIQISINNLNQRGYLLSNNNSWYKLSELNNEDYEEEEEWNNEFGDLISIKEIEKLIPKFVQKAQEVYDSWQQNDEGYDEELGVGGICHIIAENFVDILNENFNLPATTVHQEIGENHVYVIFAAEEGVFSLDIHPYVYESGGGYNWRKIPNVKFDSNHVEIHKIEGNPNAWANYIEG